MGNGCFPAEFPVEKSSVRFSDIGGCESCMKVCVVFVTLNLRINSFVSLEYQKDYSLDNLGIQLYINICSNLICQ